MMLEEGPLSDTTASAPCSDDELGSNAATDGSTLRTSPAEHGGSAGSESGGSAVDSMSGTRVKAVNWDEGVRLHLSGMVEVLAPKVGTGLWTLCQVR